MAISLRGTSTGPNSNGASTTISLPAGIAANDVSYIAVVQTGANAVTGPAGWTLVTTANLAAVGIGVWRRVYQGGDPTTGIAFTSAGSNWWESACIAYTGADTSTPEDDVNSCAMFEPSGSSFSTTNLRHTIRASSVSPNFNSSQLIYIALDSNAGGGSISLPSGAGLSSRASTGAGPSIVIGDKALTDGTPTGNLDTNGTNTSNNRYEVGVQIALKTSGASAATLAAARPTFAQLSGGYASVASLSYSPRLVNVQDGDLVAVWFGGSVVTVTPPAGYATASNREGAFLFTHTWNTGDTLTPQFTMSSNANEAFLATVIHKSGISVGNKPILDGESDGNGAGSITLAGLTPAGSNDLLTFWAANYNINAGTWSGIAPSGLTQDMLSSGTMNTLFGWKFPSASPSGSFTATLTVTGNTMDGVGALFKIGSASVAVARPVVQACG
jgi:hypothetical protein